MIRRLSLVWLSVFLSAAHAEERIILLGGGAAPASSQVSIEKNVDWITGILENNGFQDYEVMFASGSTDPTLDVKTNRWNPQLAEYWLPISRVFGDRKSLFVRYRKNTVARSELPSTRDNALALLAKTLESLESGDNLLLVYNGHGGKGKPHKEDHHLRLWNRSKLTVKDLAAVLQKQRPETTFRFVLPQCYSGPFVNLIYQHYPSDGDKTVNANRCGFVAAPHYRMSEGCTLVEDEVEYIDYSTFFFAALDGKTRLGGALGSNPDRNSDGKVDMSEAHYYATLEAYSRDVPIATSEYFLEQWQPWHIRWLSHDQPDEIAEDDYAKMARLLASRLGREEGLSRSQLLRETSHKRNELEGRLKTAKDGIEAMEQQEDQIREKLQRKTFVRWPELENPFGVTYITRAYRQMPELGAWLQDQEGYKELASLQNRIDENKENLLQLERDLGMQKRVLRFLELSRLHHQIYRFGSDAEIENYEALKQCEAWNNITYGTDKLIR